MYLRLLFYILFTCTAGSLWAADAAKIVFVEGEVRVADSPARVGQLVGEGQSLETGSNGYLYLETLDKGFFILRPNSRGQIVTYQIDATNPVNNRIKLELKNGVARHISGAAVKASRQNFRFNTPVAAVGVRGTDFTVYASQDTTRITVQSGGVIVSPLSSACTLGGFGPCDGPAGRELFANSARQMLQVNRGQVPVLLPGSDQAPDVMIPPRPDEPVVTKTSARAAPGPKIDVATSVNNLDAFKSSLVNQSAILAAPPPPAINPPLAPPPLVISLPAAPPLSVINLPAAPPQFIWGRWQALLDRTIEVDVALLQATHQLVATNAYHAILRSRDTPWQPPVQSTLGFALRQSEAVVVDQASGRITPAEVENGQLTIDFARASFFTRFDLVHLNQRIPLQNTGEVSADGKLQGGLQFLRPNNMDVRGALANDNRSAALLFQSRLDDNRLASGVTYWGK